MAKNVLEWAQMSSWMAALVQDKKLECFDFYEKKFWTIKQTMLLKGPALPPTLLMVLHYNFVKCK